MLTKLLLIGILAFLVFDVKSQIRPAKCLADENIESSLCLKTVIINLVDNANPIAIKVYTKSNPNPKIKFDRTFVVVHANEVKGLDAAKTIISQNYGRLVEIVSNAPENQNRRYLYFGSDRNLCIDPNRIYSPQGIKANLKDNDNPCQTENPDEDEGNRILNFGKRFLDIVTDHNRINFIIGVHNNDKGSGLEVNWWTEHRPEADTAVGVFKTNNHFNGEKLSADDFLLVSNPTLFNQFFNIKSPINIALQEDRAFLTETVGANKRKVKKDLDDGSMSIYFGTALFGRTGKPFSYINIEAGGKTDEEDASKAWQKRMIEQVIKVKTW